MTDEQRLALDRDGWIVLEDFMGNDLLDAARERVEQLFTIEGDQAGSEFKQEEQARRLANLVDKGEIFERLIALPEILESVGHVLGPEFKLSSFNARSTDPRSTSSQPLHADMGAIPDEKGYWVCNTVWMLDDFTTSNGAIRVVPGSHRWRRLPQQELSDPTAPNPSERLLTGTAGTVVVMNAHMWHGGTANRTDAPRRALHAFYARSDKPQQQYQKRLLRLEVQDRLSPKLRTLLALDDPHNDAVSANPGQLSGFLR
jgi:ectoine hydroxylase-related dioxygenase (phytanoyl-CoA dioxygenase family)